MQCGFLHKWYGMPSPLMPIWKCVGSSGAPVGEHRSCTLYYIIGQRPATAAIGVCRSTEFARACVLEVEDHCLCKLAITGSVFHSAIVCPWLNFRFLNVHRSCSAIEGRMSHFLRRWLRTGWQSVINQKKIPWNTPPWLGIEPEPRGGETVRFICSATELSWSTVS